MDRNFENLNQVIGFPGRLAQVLESTLEAAKQTTANLNAVLRDKDLGDASADVQPQTDLPDRGPEK